MLVLAALFLYILYNVYLYIYDLYIIRISTVFVNPCPPAPVGDVYTCMYMLCISAVCIGHYKMVLVTSVRKYFEVIIYSEHCTLYYQAFA